MQARFEKLTGRRMGAVDYAAWAAVQWLANPAVLCVGGSWVVKPGESGLDVIATRARAAAALRA